MWPPEVHSLESTTAKPAPGRVTFLNTTVTEATELEATVMESTIMKIPLRVAPVETGGGCWGFWLQL